MDNIEHFNIRVYGLLFNEKKEVLLSDEYVLEQYMTKFPGGGLKFGEGPEDCIKREAVEEFGQEIEIIEHFYTTGFYQKALFYDNQQLISIYYKIKLASLPGFKISEKPFDFTNDSQTKQSFRWEDPLLLTAEALTFPIDRYVLELIKS